MPSSLDFWGGWIFLWDIHHFKLISCSYSSYCSYCSYCSIYIKSSWHANSTCGQSPIWFGGWKMFNGECISNISHIDIDYWLSETKLVQKSTHSSKSLPKVQQSDWEPLRNKKWGAWRWLFAYLLQASPSWLTNIRIFRISLVENEGVTRELHSRSLYLSFEAGEWVYCDWNTYNIY
jgi:hypothetical protein